jgi:type IV pilus assembly protein PilW
MTAKQAAYLNNPPALRASFKPYAAFELSAMKMNTYNNTKRGSRMIGLGLIEIMISMVLGIFLVGGVITLFTSNQQSFKVNENLAQIQEGARFAYEQMNREVRDAGTNPCGVRAVNSVVRTPSLTIPWWGDWNAGTIRGYDASEGIAGSDVTFGTSVDDRVTGTDALLVLRTLSEETLLRTVAAHNTVSNQFTLNSPAKLRQQDLIFVCDSSSGAILEIVTPSGTAATSNITHDSTPPSSNCSDSLGWANNVNCNLNSVAKTFTVGSVITKFDPAIWYIGVSSTTGRRGLFRESIHKDTSPDIIKTERREFVPDVHDMQIKYLTRTNPIAGSDTASVLATDWVDASTINAQAGAWSNANLTEAIAVRIELTFRSKESVGTDGVVSKPIERKSISIISLRNRELRP